MTATERLKRLDDICQYVFHDLGLRGIQTSCIQGSALLLKVLHGTGFAEAYPLAVGVTICNDAFLEHSKTHGPAKTEAELELFNETGCLLMSVGYGGPTLDGKVGWEGHLVVVVPKVSGDRHAMIDLTIVQLDRPEWGAPMNPLRLGVGDPFVTGRSHSEFKHNGLFMVYEARPNDRSYRDDGNLLAIEGLGQAAENIVRNLRLSRVI